MIVLGARLDPCPLVRRGSNRGLQQHVKGIQDRDSVGMAVRLDRKVKAKDNDDMDSLSALEDIELRVPEWWEPMCV